LRQDSAWKLMTTPLFDVQCGFGSVAPGSRDLLPAPALLAEMDRLGVARALVRMAPAALEIDIPLSNARLYADCAANPRLVPCPIVVPNGARDGNDETEQVDEAIRRGARAVVIRPRMDYWSVAPWCSGRLFEVLEERRLPVICLVADVSYDDVAALAGRYPNLPLIITAADYRSQRILLPLLEAFRSVSLSLGSNYVQQGGIEQCVATVGAQRLLFGTGFPEVDMTGAISYLSYSEIAAEEKQMIGAGNLDRLVQGVQR
jgi:uncharacterized protein